MAETIGKGDGAATAAGDTKGEPPPNDSGKASDADAKVGHYEFVLQFPSLNENAFPHLSKKQDFATLYCTK